MLQKLPCRERRERTNSSLEAFHHDFSCVVREWVSSMMRLACHQLQQPWPVNVSKSHCRSRKQGCHRGIHSATLSQLQSFTEVRCGCACLDNYPEFPPKATSNRMHIRVHVCTLVRRFHEFVWPELELPPFPHGQYCKHKGSIEFQLMHEISVLPRARDV